jgi:hypothetical protein
MAVAVVHCHTLFCDRCGGEMPVGSPPAEDLAEARRRAVAQGWLVGILDWCGVCVATMRMHRRLESFDAAELHAGESATGL